MWGLGEGGSGGWAGGSNFLYFSLLIACMVCDLIYLFYNRMLALNGKCDYFRPPPPSLSLSLSLAARARVLVHRSERRLLRMRSAQLC